MGWVPGVVQSSILAGWLVAQVSGGGTPWDARVQQGVELRLAGHEAEALVVFREAAKTATTPRLLAQTALAEQSLGQWREAEAHLLEALASADDPWIVKQRSALDAALVTIRRHLGSLELLGASRGELFVDGRPEGTLPSDHPLRLELGRHRVEVRSPGSLPFARDVEITAETTSRETVALAPLPPATTPIRNEAPESPGALAPPAAPSTTHRFLGWSFVGGGAAVAIVGVVSLLTSNAHAGDYNSDPACTGGADEPSTCTSSASSARGWRVASIASFAVAGTLGAAGVVVLLWKSSPASSPAGVRVQLAPSSHGAQLGFTHTF